MPNLSSFYGGKSGITYAIVKHYDSVQQMCQDFAKGGSNNEVGYGEYVIVDTIINQHNKSNPENGLLYRRGFEYNDPIVTPPDDTDYKADPQNNRQAYQASLSQYFAHPGAGAEYIGQIVGPQGETPEMHLVPWSELEKAIADGNIPSYYKRIYLLKEPDDATPGKVDINDTTIQLQEHIQYGYFVATDDNGNVIGSKISFRFPYPVFEITAASGTPYGPRINQVSVLDPGGGNEGEYYEYNGKTYIWDTTAKITSTTDEDGIETVHQGGMWIEATPWSAHYDADEKHWVYDNLIREKSQSQGKHFFKSFDITIPRGLHGTDVKEIGIHKKKQDDKERSYFYYKTTDYTNKEQGEVSKEIELGDYRVIAYIDDNHQDHPKYTPYSVGQDYKAGDIVSDSSLPDDLLLIATRGGQSTGSWTYVANGQPAASLYGVTGTEFNDGDIIWKVIYKNYIPPDLLKIHYTAGKDDTVKIRVVDNIQWDDDGRVYVKYTDLKQRTYLGEGQDIISVTFDQTSPYLQNLVVHYNTYNRDENGQIVVDNTFQVEATQNGATVNETWYLGTDGQITGQTISAKATNVRIIKYPITDSTGRRVQYIPTAVKFLTDAFIDEDLFLNVRWNTQSKAQKFEKVKFKTINKVWLENKPETVNGQLDEHLNDNKTLKVNYKVGDHNSDGTDAVNGLGDEATIAEKINYIVDACLYGDNLCLLWADPTYRDNLTKYYELTRQGTKAAPGAIVPIYKWQNLGPILNGNHIIGNFASLAELKAAYPNGFGTDAITANRAGWVATVSSASTDSTGASVTSYALYAYDYIGNRGWYKIQDLSSDSIDPHYTLLMAPKVVDDNGAELNQPDHPDEAKLNNSGYWNVVDDNKVKAVSEKLNSGNYATPIPIGTDGIYVDMASDLNLEQELKLGGNHSTQISYPQPNFTNIIEDYFDNTAARRIVYRVQTKIQQNTPTRGKTTIDTILSVPDYTTSPVIFKIAHKKTTTIEKNNIGSDIIRESITL